MKNKKFTVVEVNRIAFNNETVILENESARITLQLKDQKDHGKHEKGKTKTISFSSKEEAAASESTPPAGGESNPGTGN